MKINRLNVLKELPRLLAFSFGLAFCVFVLVSVSLVVVTNGSSFLDPSLARMVFAPAFFVSLIYLAVRELRKKGGGEGN